jgi:uncharacterized protein (DUF2344 family)
MKILKYIIIFLVLYLASNIAYWSYQEYIYSDDMQDIKSLGNIINIARVSIEEKDQSIERQQKILDEDKIVLDQLLADKKYAQYNELVPKYNQAVNEFNLAIKEYEDLVNIHNQNVDKVNEIILNSGNRKYIFPIKSYTPELYKKIN